MKHRVLILVQTRVGYREFELPAERLNHGGAVFVSNEPLGADGDRLLIDVIRDGGQSSDSVDIVGSVERFMPGIGTQVRFRWPESSRDSQLRFARYLQELSVVPLQSDFPITVFAMAA